MSAITTYGEVELQQTQIASTVPGRLVPLPSQPSVKQFDRVARGQLLAKLDDGPALAALAALRKELSRLESELRAKEEDVRLADQDRKQTSMVEARRLAILVDDLRLRVIDRKALIEIDRIEFQRQQALYEMVQSAGSAASPKERLEVQLLRDAAQQRVRSNEEALRQADVQLQVAVQRASALPEAGTTELEKLLAPIRAAIAAEQARVEEMELRDKALYIYSPAEGYVSSVNRRPGDVVLAGENILTIVNDRSQHIVSYIRQEHRLKPSTEMMVEIRSRVDGGRPVRASVARMGSHYEPIPVHQARDPKIMEWGIPVLISIPFGLDVRPGELVEVRFGPNNVGR